MQREQVKAQLAAIAEDMGVTFEWTGTTKRIAGLKVSMRYREWARSGDPVLRIIIEAGYLLDSGSRYGSRTISRTVKVDHAKGLNPASVEKAVKSMRSAKDADNIAQAKKAHETRAKEKVRGITLKRFGDRLPPGVSLNDDGTVDVAVLGILAGDALDLIAHMEAKGIR